MEKQIKEAEKELETKREKLREKRQGTKVKHEQGISDTEAFDPFILQNKIKAMKVKIENQKTKLNEIFCQNNILKNSVNHLRREKKIFEDIREQLQFDIKQKESQLLELREDI